MSQSAINEQNQKFTVVASFYPVYAIANYIMQGSSSTELINLTSNNEGVCLHNYSLLPNDMATIENCDVFLTCGDDVTSSVDISNKVDVAQNYSDMEHLWMDFDGAMSMANTIANTLADKDWKNKTTYLENANNFVEEARTQESLMKSKIDGLSQKHIISLDSALTNFANSIGLSVIGGASDTHETDSADSIATIEEYISAVEQYNINTIIVPIGTGDSQTVTMLKNELANQGYQMNVIELSSILSGNNDINDYFTQVENDFDTLYNSLSQTS